MMWNSMKAVICLLFRVQSNDAILRWVKWSRKWSCRIFGIVLPELILILPSVFLREGSTLDCQCRRLLQKKNILTTFIYASSFMLTLRKSYHVTTQLLWPSLTKPIRSTGSLCNFMTKFKVNERTTRRESNLLIKVKLNLFN